MANALATSAAEIRVVAVKVKPSKTKNKRIDVYKNGKKMVSVGGYGYDNYPTFMKTRGKTYANKKRRLYKLRHEKDRHVKGSAGYYADQLLW